MKHEVGPARFVLRLIRTDGGYATTVQVTLSVCCRGPLVAMMVSVKVPSGDAAAS